MKLPSRINIRDHTPMTLNERFTELQSHHRGGPIRRRPYNMQRGAPLGRGRGVGVGRYDDAYNDRLRGVRGGRIERQRQDRQVEVMQQSSFQEQPSASAAEVGRGSNKRRSHAFRIGRHTVEFVNSNRFKPRMQQSGYPGNEGYNRSGGFGGGNTSGRRYGSARGARGRPSRRGRGGRGGFGGRSRPAPEPDYVIEEKPAAEKAELDRQLEEFMHQPGSALNMELSSYYNHAKGQEDF